VDDVTAKLVMDASSAREVMENKEIAVMVDPDLKIMQSMVPTVIVDGRMIKSASKLESNNGKFVVGLGPGFDAGKNCDAVIETNRGARLGRVFWKGGTEPDTGIPEQVKQYAADRVLRAPANGNLVTLAEICDYVQTGQKIGEVSGISINAKFEGVIRGLLRNGITVKTDMKIGDLDPRGLPELATMISDKALAVGGGVLEAILSKIDFRKQLLCEHHEIS
jgi:xanthine dehydrogenase accessory factor